MSITVLQISNKYRVPVVINKMVNVNGKLSKLRFIANPAPVKTYGGNYNPERDSAMMGAY